MAFQPELNELSKEDMINRLFKKLHSQLLTDGIIINKGSIIDASFVNDMTARCLMNW